MAVDMQTCRTEKVTGWAGKFSELIISGNIYKPPIEAPKPVSPEGYINNMYPLIKWEPVPRAHGYFFSISQSSPGVNRNFSCERYVQGTSYQVDSNSHGILSDMHPIYWRVAAIDENGLGRFSEPLIYNLLYSKKEIIPGSGERMGFTPDYVEYNKEKNTVETRVSFYQLDSRSVAVGLCPASITVYCGMNKIEMINEGCMDLNFKANDNDSMSSGMKDVTPGSIWEILYNHFCR